MNKVIVAGRLTHDPDVRYTAAGKAVASFTLAVNRRVNGEEKADFIPIVAWEKLAEICGNNLTKGRLVLLEGRLQFRSYETEAGEKRKVAEVVALHVEFMDRPKDDTSSKTAATGDNIDFSEFGEDLPF